MRDIVERLRELSRRGYWPLIGDEAADEIERLRNLLSGRARFTEVERLRAELAAALNPTGEELKFKIGDRVRKIRGAAWQGRVVGRYSTALTKEGVAVESEAHPGSVQIYPVDVLEALGDKA